jgi:hypothetical protein
MINCFVRQWKKLTELEKLRVSGKDEQSSFCSDATLSLLPIVRRRF